MGEHVEAYVRALGTLLAELDVQAIERVVGRLEIVQESQRTVFVAGNGGSAATASHWVNDLNNSTRRPGRPAIRARSLTDSTPWLTALANDVGYESVFSGQIDLLGSAGDMLVVISASGNSPNVIRGVEHAHRAGLVTVALVGFDGGELNGLVDEAIWIRTPLGEYGLVESVHSVVCDIITTLLSADQGSEPWGPNGRTVE